MSVELAKGREGSVESLFDSGCAHFEREEYAAAIEILQRGLESTEEKSAAMVSDLQMWIRMCNHKLDSTRTQATTEPRYEWYQTSDYVNLAFYVKDRTENDLEVVISKRELAIRITLPDSNVYQVDFNPLYQPVNPNASHYTIGKYKIEVKLSKADSIAWKAVRGTDTDTDTALASDGKDKKNWDAVLEEEDKPEGDAGLNQLFRDIYGKATDETRMAMNKSFMESGGTVLSTNWNEVKTKPVEMTPPEGMESKRYGQ
jgi:suppressor of G2 allele of SKP1